MTHAAHCCECHAREQFLDGYRHGLGLAIRAVDQMRTACATDLAITIELTQANTALNGVPDVQTVIATLRGVANGLRRVSASTTLERDDQ